MQKTSEQKKTSDQKGKKMSGPKKTFEEISAQANRMEEKAHAEDLNFYQSNLYAGSRMGELIGRERNQTIISMGEAILNKYPLASPLSLGENVSSGFMEDVKTVLDFFQTNCLTPLVDMARQRNTTKFNVSEERKNRENAEKMNDIIKMFDAVRASLNHLFRAPESDNLPFINLYSDIMKFMDYQESITRGNLVVPLDSDKKLDDKTIRRVNNYTIKTVDGVKKKVYKSLAPVKSYQQKNWKKRLDEYNKAAAEENAKNEKKFQEHKITVLPEKFKQATDLVVFDKKETGPLFDHEPCTEDIKQGVAGDCYFVGALSALAGKNPQAIRDAMVDNDDGTCTVRFFNEKNEPVFVTVDKTIPYKKFTFVDGTQGITPVYSKGPLWLKIMEKAFAASELKGSAFKTGYEGIESGNPNNALHFLLGPSSEKGLKSQIVHFGTDPQTRQENFTMLKQHHDRGLIITCATKNDKVNGDQAYEATKGLPGSHVYTVTNVTLDPQGQKWVHIRNPHAGGGRERDVNGEAFYDPDHELDGVSVLPYEEFCDTFDYVAIVDYDKRPDARLSAAQGQALNRLYGDAMLRCCRILTNHDNYHQIFRSDEGFNKLRGHAVAAEKALTQHPIVWKELDENMTKLLNSAAEYKKLRDNNPQELSKDLQDYAANRYFAAQILCEIGKAVRNNNAMRSEDRTPVDFDNIVHDTLFEDQFTSSAHKAMVEVVSQRDKPCGGLAPKETIALRTAKMMREDCFESLRTICNQSGATDQELVGTMSKFLYLDKVCKSSHRVTPNQLFELLTVNNLEKGTAAYNETSLAMIQSKDAKAVFSAIKNRKPLEDVTRMLKKLVPALSVKVSKDRLDQASRERASREPMMERPLI